MVRNIFHENRAICSHCAGNGVPGGTARAIHGLGVKESLACIERVRSGRYAIGGGGVALAGDK